MEDWWTRSISWDWVVHRWELKPCESIWKCRLPLQIVKSFCLHFSDCHILSSVKSSSHLCSICSIFSWLTWWIFLRANSILWRCNHPYNDDSILWIDLLLGYPCSIIKYHFSDCHILSNVKSSSHLCSICSIFSWLTWWIFILFQEFFSLYSFSSSTTCFPSGFR